MWSVKSTYTIFRANYSNPEMIKLNVSLDYIKKGYQQKDLLFLKLGEFKRMAMVQDSIWYLYKNSLQVRSCNSSYANTLQKLLLPIAIQAYEPLDMSLFVILENLKDERTVVDRNLKSVKISSKFQDDSLSYIDYTYTFDSSFFLKSFVRSTYSSVMDAFWYDSIVVHSVEINTLNSDQLLFENMGLLNIIDSSKDITRVVIFPLEDTSIHYYKPLIGEYFDRKDLEPIFANPTDSFDPSLPTVVTYWNTSCGPCRLAHSKIKQLRQDTLRFNWLTINETDSLNKIESYIQQGDFPFSVYTQTQLSIEKLHAVPLILILNEDGKIIQVNTGFGPASIFLIENRIKTH